MSKRPPNELESRLHQAALSSPNKELTNKQAEAIIPDIFTRQSALNFLLGVGLFKSLVDARGSVSFRAVTKNELEATKGLSGEENLVLGHIKVAYNEGIWVKHLKAKTNLHQTILDRCLKTLTQKRLIKCVSSVQYPTRKIYMLENLDPSITLTGGPWYTDKELDTEFIQHLRDACLKFIRDLSFPNHRGEGTEGALYALSNAPNYPSAQHIRNSLKKARLTETDLSVEHVEMLLDVLILDGEIEKIPSFGTSIWDAKMDNSESSDESRPSPKKKRRRTSDDIGPSKRKRRRSMSSDDDSSSDNLSRKKNKRKRDKRATDSEEESGDTTGEERKSRTKKRKNKKRKDHESSSDESDHRSRPSKSSKSMKRSPSPFQAWDDLNTSGGSVYRAIKQEQLSLGNSEAPCSQCPSFEFCKDGGPVNPRECVYYSDWLVAGTVTALEANV